MLVRIDLNDENEIHFMKFNFMKTYSIGMHCIIERD